ncbi:hypothetical protein [Sulfoacidibacillus thermotolerans]|uniref:Uncharacterized protein n=1 Tax=Sulfoacidibacillus thermotolerans TaxID=1765684 RepID=A0A2U3D631_SULT2|nr:hypothetical protein [Sulfoacidibacillus thermotolerans]PWI56730.1 hypothetical protein BM613_12195 [Sulfoacidibacillus thermotolerans]
MEFDLIILLPITVFFFLLVIGVIKTNIKRELAIIEFIAGLGLIYSTLLYLWKGHFTWGIDFSLIPFTFMVFYGFLKYGKGSGMTRTQLKVLVWGGVIVGIISFISLV